MGIFSRFSKSTSDRKVEQQGLQWKDLSSEEELENLILRSKEKPQLIFKNSTSCGVSRMVLRSFESSFVSPTEKADFYLIHVQHSRALSNLIAEKFQVIHQSPQLLIIDKGTVVNNASHGAINDIPLTDYL